MAAPPADKAKPAGPATPGSTSKVKEGVWIAVVVVVGICVAAFFVGGDNDPVTAADPIDVNTVVADLDRAATAHGICYGWQLLDSSSPVSTGSNLGAGKRVTDNPEQCPKYIEVHGRYRYYPDSSESEDYATYSIATNLSNASHLDASAFDRLGAGTSRLLDDPTSTILDAAQALPLLAQEAGVATGAVPAPSASGTPAPLPSAGNDFWRDRWVLLLVTGVLLAGAVVTLLLGIRSSRRIKRGEETDPFAKTAAKQ
ncbi:hypothetical protein GCM10010399_29290 [Dactylosporangium fulvum]|uniref:Uncharacterized protein n=1 Tax=Dactylosporangium fulvum TaxID=53359 RepID=A0ABY5WA29_9ACTN|nr:hypothetical protein [Dactylosporangium fulvum]UWP86205.1 hypothetical protein Dfulv_18965 [Dactylosporangium fulvum]